MTATKNKSTCWPIANYQLKTANFFSLLITAYCLLAYVTIHSEIRYVSHTGSSTPPYTTWETAADSIQKAINICNNGDTVIVANGVYYENLVIDSSITLIGSSMDSTVIDGRGLGDYTITFNANGNIENFSLYGRGESYPCRVIRSNTLYNTLLVRNCRLSDAGVGIEVGADIIADNLFMINLTRGINLFGESANSISDCVIILDNENSKGITLGFAPNGNYFITNNILLFAGTNTPDEGISVGSVRKIYVNNNLISGFLGCIFFDTVLDTAYIINNVLTYSAGAITSSGNGIYVNNVVLSKNNHGIQQIGGGWIISNYNLFWENYIEDLNGLSFGDSDRVANPMFIKDTLPNPQMDFDYHLQAYSPGIDKGDPDILDIDSSRSDIGLYGGPFGEEYTYQDLAPKSPRNPSAIVDTNRILLNWNKNTESDTAFYNIYRDTVINFMIDTTKLITSQIDTFYIQIPPYENSQYVYKITCVDNQGNESAPSEEVVVNITSIEDYPFEVSDYFLYQNYPNPFNPSTSIGYKLKERGYVKLMIYDIKGELVSVLVNKEQEAGYYEVEFNSEDRSQRSEARNGLASGIYLYRIEVIGEGNIPVYSDMKKMILIK